MREGGSLPESGESGLVVLGAPAHFDLPLAHAHLERWLRSGRRPGHDPAVERERAAVALAGDGSLAQRALGERAAAVGAAIGDCVDLTAVADEQHAGAARLAPDRLPGLE